MPAFYSAILHLTPRPEPASAFHLALREWIGHRWPHSAAWFSLNEPGSLQAPDGSIFRWEPHEDVDSSLHELTWRHPHIDDPSISWSTQAALYSRPGWLRLNLRVNNTGPEFPAPAALTTTRPRLLLSLVNHFTARIGSYRCLTSPRVLPSDDIPDFVRYELLDGSREHPILLLSPNANGTFAPSPEAFARETVGLAELCVLESPAAGYRLTDELDRRELSCFHGGIRAYLPGFTLAANPFSHPLLIGKRASQQEERARLCHFLAYLTTRQYREDPILNELRDARAVRYHERRQRTVEALDVARLAAAEAGEWEQLAIELDKDNVALRVELAKAKEDLEEALATVSRQRYALSRRSEPAAELEAPGPEYLPGSVLEAVELAQTTLSDRLLILPTAIASAADSPYYDPVDVYSTLRKLAEYSGRLATGPLGRNPKDVFIDMGLDFAPGISEATPKKLRQQYRFRGDGCEHVCEAHLRLGASTYDPSQCLRIYFCMVPDSTQRLAVGHVGRHLEVQTST